MRRLLPLLAVALLGCSDDKSPTAPGDRVVDGPKCPSCHLLLELVGTWVGVSSTDPDATDEKMQATTAAFNVDGSFTISFSMDDVSISVSGTWAVVDGKIITVATLSGETVQESYAYTIRGDRLTLVDDDDGAVEIWERQ